MSGSNRHIEVGVFVPPHHSNTENVALAMRRDLALAEWLDELGYAELWMGEHHSGGMQIYGSPEMFIAAAAERTRRIRLGAGVISLPYHNPFMVADRIVQLDNQTQGRAMFGFGPGALASDAHMMGIPVAKSRDRLAQGIEVIIRLLDGETITETTDWYTLKDARLHITPFSHPRPPLAVASLKTPTGAITAGRYNMELLCANAAGANDALKFATQAAAEQGRTYDRSRLRVVGSFHLAETREEARRLAQHGMSEYFDYGNIMRPPNPNGAPSAGDPIEQVLAMRGGVIGTPDEAIGALEKLWDLTGGFGCLLLQGTNWMDFEATKRSYELFMRYVLPAFTGRNKSRADSFEWMQNNAVMFSNIRDEAAAKAMGPAKPAPTVAAKAKAKSESTA
ncbi:MAG: monooxygenase [Rhodospirillales bacterium]|nr:monooxygenase [Rhodospirillales bacterium]